MPQLKRLSCSIQWADTGAPFSEYGIVYGDGLVETFVVVPSKPQPFAIRLKSLDFIYEGLAVIVFIDGNYQTNRNRVNLKPQKNNVPFNRTQIDFLLRQREKPIGDQVYMGRLWRFDNHNIIEKTPEGVKESHFDQLGTIEVLVLRCRARMPEEIDASGSSSAADSDALGENGDRIGIDEDNNDEDAIGNRDGAVEEQRKGVQPNEEQYEDVFAGLFAGDATNDTRASRDTGQRALGVPGNAGPPPWELGNASNARHLARTSSMDSHHPNHQQFYNTSERLQQPQPQHSAAPKRHVRFNTDAEPSSSRPQEPPPVPPKPAAYHEARRIPSGPPFQSRQLYRHPSFNTVAQPNVHPTIQFQQQPRMMTLNSRTIPQFPPTPTTGPRNSSVSYAPQQYQNPPHLLAGGVFPRHQHIWPPQPPHIIYNPYQLHPGSHWPNFRMPDSGSGVATQATPSKSPNASSRDLQENATSEQRVSDSRLKDWSTWSNDNANSNVAPNDSGNWNGNQTQDNTGSSWHDNAQGTSQNDTSNQNWSNDVPNNNTNTAGFESHNDNNHNTSLGNDDKNDQENTENNNWQDSGTNNNVATNWPSADDNSKGDNNNSWDQANATKTRDTNDASNDNQYVPEAVRALYGPHGQYYTYDPRGPDEPPPDVEEEPRYDVPKKVATATESTKQVLPGSGYRYYKKRCAPEYMDSMDDPYARFIFKYRTADQLEKEVGIKIEGEPTGDQAVQELQAMNRQALIEMLIRAKSALGGRVPSPPPRPATTTGDQGVPVPVEPPNHQFLNYKLPELRQMVASAVGSSRDVRGGQRSDIGGGAGSSAPQAWDKPNNNNDSTWAQPGNIDWDTNKTSNATQNWNRSWDGAGERARTERNLDSNLSWSQPAISQSIAEQQADVSTTWRGPNRNTTGFNQVQKQDEHLASAQSSPSTLPLDQPYNPRDSEVPPLLPLHASPYGNCQYVDDTVCRPPGAYPDLRTAGPW